ncbi:hypothetical protein [Planomonospora venezuelensis]
MATITGRRSPSARQTTLTWALTRAAPSLRPSREPYSGSGSGDIT